MRRACVICDKESLVLVLKKPNQFQCSVCHTMWVVKYGIDTEGRECAIVFRDGVFSPPMRVIPHGRLKGKV